MADFTFMRLVSIMNVVKDDHNLESGTNVGSRHLFFHFEFQFITTTLLVGTTLESSIGTFCLV